MLKIERVQHSKLWRRYALRRSEIEDARSKQGEGFTAQYACRLVSVAACAFTATSTYISQSPTFLAPQCLQHWQLSIPETECRSASQNSSTCDCLNPVPLLCCAALCPAGLNERLLFHGTNPGEPAAALEPTVYHSAVACAMCLPTFIVNTCAHCIAQYAALQLVNLVHLSNLLPVLLLFCRHGRQDCT